jgi:hypothetical protein
MTDRCPETTPRVHYAGTHPHHGCPCTVTGPHDWHRCPHGTSWRPTPGGVDLDSLAVVRRGVLGRWDRWLELRRLRRRWRAAHARDRPTTRVTYLDGNRDKGM